MARGEYHKNFLKYKYPPTYEQVMEVIKKSGLSIMRFEAIHGMYNNCVNKLKRNNRNIPVQHWHLFYEDEKKLIPVKTRSYSSPPAIKRTKVKPTGALSNLLS